MKILLMSLGTRGDIEPFLAVGELLKQQGHEVSAAFPEQFGSLTKECQIPFFSLGPEFLEMLASKAGKTVLGAEGNKINKLLAYISLAKKQQRLNKTLIRRQQSIVEELQPDLILHHAKIMYPVIWELSHPKQTILLSAVPYLHYVKGHAHLAFNANWGSFLNKLTYQLADWGLVKTILSSAKTLGRNDIKSSQIKQVLQERTFIYTISRQLFSPPAEWINNPQVLGYYERTKTANWTPSKDLEAFLNQHKKVLFLTFGSMINSNPLEKTKLFVEILCRNKIPTVVNTAAGGLVKVDQYDKSLIHFVQDIPYEWIFPKVYAVIHHGGSGTTHTVAKHGCASLVIPHIIDQFVWDDILTQKGIGPKGISIAKLSPKKLEDKIMDLFNNPKYKQNAEKLAEAMKQENDVQALIHTITR